MTVISDKAGLDARRRQEAVAVIPCYNAGDALLPVVRGALAELDRVIVVDDGSTDDAPTAAATAGARVVRLERNRGKGYALLAGFAAALEHAETACVITLDADGQHNPKEIPRLFEAFAADEADFVIGARTFGGQEVPFRSWLGNTMTAGLLGVLIGAKLPDTQSGFRLHSRRFAEAIVREVAPGRYETEMEIVVRAVRGGYGLSSVPIQTIYEKGNPSSHFKKVRDSWRIYRRLFGAIRAARRQ